MGANKANKDDDGEKGVVKNEKTSLNPQDPGEDYNDELLEQKLKNILLKFSLHFTLARQKKDFLNHKRSMENYKGSMSKFTIFSFSSFFDTGDSNKNDSRVLRYWGKEIDEMQLKQEFLAANVIQTRVRLWLIARQSTANNKIRKQNETKNIIILQAGIRRWLDCHLQDRLVDREKKDASFDKFCLTMKEGIRIGMYSRKYGNLNTRFIQFDDKRERLVWTISAKATKSVPLRSLFKAGRGLSGYGYAAPPRNAGFCFHVVCAGGRALDFEAEAHKDSIFLLDGFQRLILMMDGTSSFYINDNGLPYRAGPSVINNAIERETIRVRNKKGASKSLQSKWAFNIVDIAVTCM